MTDPLELDPDRLFPSDTETRDIARELYANTADLPIISPHGHVDPRILLTDESFPDPAELFVRSDHYVTRLLHAGGVSFDELGFSDASGRTTPAPPREVWRKFCERWHLFAGTASGYWLQSCFGDLFSLTEQPEAENADRLFDELQETLQTDAFRPRALFDRFDIEVMTTTDDPLDDLSVHAEIASSGVVGGRVLPTFRPDAYLDPTATGWAERIERLAAWNGSAAGSFDGYLDALAGRRRYFIEHGAISTDHGVATPFTVDLSPDEAQKLFDRALRGDIDAAEARLFAGHMLLQMARMSVDDGLVMTVHPGVIRNHHQSTLERFGPDTGHDIPFTTTFVDGLRPLLQRYGEADGFHLVLFTVDETTFSRELAPLAGFYPSVYIGAPWWFLDAPDAVLRFRAAVTETAGFYRGSGFIDDTRAFLSISARHDMSRRLDAAFLARYVREGRIDRLRAARIAYDLVRTVPQTVFKL